MLQRGKQNLKIWEAILYGIFGGATELLPISFSGHYALLRDAFHLPSLSEGEGAYIRIAICLGVIAALLLTLHGEAGQLGKELLFLTGLKKRRRHDFQDRAYVRSVLILALPLVMMLLSLIYAEKASHVGKLVYVAGFFALNGLLIFWSARGASGQKTEKHLLLTDALLIGLARMVSVFPGLSPLNSSMFAGQFCGLHREYNIRIAYMLTLAYECASIIYHIVRAVLYGAFSLGLLLPMAVVLALTTLSGYLAIQYFRYLLQRGKIGFFSYYCWDAAIIALVLALINK